LSNKAWKLYLQCYNNPLYIQYIQLCRSSNTFHILVLLGKDNNLRYYLSRYLPKSSFFLLLFLINKIVRYGSTRRSQNPEGQDSEGLSNYPGGQIRIFSQFNSNNNPLPFQEVKSLQTKHLSLQTLVPLINFVSFSDFSKQNNCFSRNFSVLHKGLLLHSAH